MQARLAPAALLHYALCALTLAACGQVTQGQGTVGPTPTPMASPTPLGSAMAVFDPNAPAFPVMYSPQEKQAQRDAGATMASGVEAAINSGVKDITIPPGVYRISRPMSIFNSTGVTITADKVELIAENAAEFFRLINNRDFVWRGTTIMDGDPFGFSQGTIVGTDNATYIDLKLWDNYPVPVSGHRVMFFSPDGRMQPHFQCVVNATTPMANNVYRLALDSWVFNSYPVTRADVIKVGNFMSLENTENAGGGFEMRSNTNVSFYDIFYHTSSLIWGFPEYGTDHFERWRGMRRPGTNRLGAGGPMQITLHGGSYNLIDSELSYNFDDLTDIVSLFGYTWKNKTPNQIYGVLTDEAGVVGETLNIYNFDTLELDYRAKVIAKDRVNDANMLSDYGDYLQALNLIRPPALYLITLDSNVDVSDFHFLESEEGRPQSINMINSYLHDNLAGGIQTKGARQSFILNNIVERVAYRCIAVGYDLFWYEGTVVANVTVSNNVLTDCSYALPTPTAAIEVYNDLGINRPHATGPLIHNVQITDNVIVNPHVWGIGVSNAQNVTIERNVVVNPVARRYDTQGGVSRPYPHASVVYLDAVGAPTVVRDNTFYDVDPQLAPEVIRFSPKSNPSYATLASNRMVARDGSLTRVPDVPWIKIDDSADAVTYIGPWTTATPNNGAHGTTVHESSAPGAIATFNFYGNRARYYGETGAPFAMVDVYLDGVAVGAVDASLTPPYLLTANTLGDQMLFDTGPIVPGNHQLRVVLKNPSGSRSTGLGLKIGVDAFDYINEY